MAGIKIPDVIALTGRTYKGACTASETAFGKLCPLRILEIIMSLTRPEIISLNICKREHIKFSLDILPDTICIAIRCLLKRTLDLLKECCTLLCIGLPEDLCIILPCSYIAARLRCIDSEGAAEAGILRSIAGLSDDDAVLSPVLIICIDRIA